MRQYDATSSVATELINTVFENPYEIQEQDGNVTRSGYEGIYLYGLMGAGKTTDIIQLFDTVCRYQEPYEGKRRIHVGVLRNSNSDFMLTLGKSFGYWYKEQEKVDFRYGFKIMDANIRPKVVVRFPSWQYGYDDEGNVTSVPDGLDCEITYFCYSANDKGDEDKMKGGEFTCVWSNEMNTIPQAAHDMLTARGDRYPPNGATHSFWIGDANPKNKSAWEYQAYINPPNPSVKTIKYPSPLYFSQDSDGTTKYKGKLGEWKIDPSVVVHRSDKQGNPDYKYWLRLTNKSDTFVENNIEGEYSNIREGEVVHDGFNPDRHVSPMALEPNPYSTILVCIDFGVKCGAVVMYYDDEGNFRQLKDFISDSGFKFLYRQIKSYLMNELTSHYNRKKVLFIGDPRTGTKKSFMDNSTSISLILEDFDEDHYVVPRTESGGIMDNIDYRVNTVDEYMKRDDGYIIDPRCTTTIDAFSFGYIKDENTGKPDKKRSGKYAEIADCVQYGMTYIALGGEIATSYTSSSSSGPAIHHAY